MDSIWIEKLLVPVLATIVGALFRAVFNRVGDCIKRRRKPKEKGVIHQPEADEVVRYSKQQERHE